MGSLIRRSVEVVISPSPVLVLEGMIPEMWVSHQPTAHRTGPATSALLEMIHPDAAAIVVKSRH